MIKIGILEDDSLMRLALAEALRSSGHEIVFETGEANSFIELSGKRHLEVGIFDIYLGGSINGIDVATKLRTIYPELGIVFITSFSDHRLIPGGPKELPSGAVYLQKEKIQSIKALDEAIQSALTRSVGKTANSTALSGLTDSQVEILRLVAKGMSNSQIAESTSTSVKNVEGIISRIIKSLGLQDLGNQNQRVHMARVYFRSRGVRLDEE